MGRQKDSGDIEKEGEEMTKNHTKLLGRKIYKLLGPYIRHEGTCHHVNWGGYCDCGIPEIKKKIKKLLKEKP